MTLQAGEREGSTFAVGDTALGQVVGRELDANFVAGHDPNKVSTHPACDVNIDDVSTFDLDAKSGVRQCLNNDSFHLKCFFFFFLLRH